MIEFFEAVGSFRFLQYALLTGILASIACGVVGSYVVEGHVPADDVKRMLRERPNGVRGLAVPGMPVGSPGMEQGPPSQYERYQVMAFTAAGATSVFATHGPPAR